MSVKFIEYHDRPLDFTDPIMEGVRPDMADHIREVWGIAKVGEKKIKFELKYNSLIFSVRKVKTLVRARIEMEDIYGKPGKRAG